MATEPKLIDLSVDLLPIDGMSTEEIQKPMASAKSEESHPLGLPYGQQLATVK